MSQRKKSKEELFLKKLCELAKQTGDPRSEVDRYAVGKRIEERGKKGTDHTVQMLVKSGFLKRGNDPCVYLTQQGVHFVKELEK